MDATSEYIQPTHPIDRLADQIKQRNKELRERYGHLLTPELEKMGFVIDCGIAGCCTIPCFQGKLPHSRGAIPCAIIRSTCNKSPIEQMET